MEECCCDHQIENKAQKEKCHSENWMLKFNVFFFSFLLAYHGVANFMLLPRIRLRVLYFCIHNLPFHFLSCFFIHQKFHQSHSTTTLKTILVEIELKKINACVAECNAIWFQLKVYRQNTSNTWNHSTSKNYTLEHWGENKSTSIEMDKKVKKTKIFVAFAIWAQIQ